MTANAAPGTRTRLLAWGLCLLTLAMVAAAATLVALNLESIRTPDEASAIEIVLAIGFAIMGGLVAARQPSNALGWLFLAMALTTAVPAFALQYSRFALVTAPGVPFSPWIPWLGSLAETLVYPSGLATIAILLIPNGRFLSPRWRLVAWMGAAITALQAMVTILDPGLILFEGDLELRNPVGIAALAGILLPIGLAAFMTGLVVLVVAGASVVIRLRRSTGVERLQLRWVAYAVAISILLNLSFTLVGIFFLPEAMTGFIGSLVTIIGFGIALPASFGVAILRYRLYDLDLLLNRTVLYGAVTVVLGLAFFGANLLVQRTVESVFGARSDLLAAALGVVAGLAYGPMSRAVRPIVDRALPPRSRLTLLFTDIVESTQAIVDLGDERWREVLFRYRAMVRREIARHRGREVNTAGDAFFAVFGQSPNAVRCAVAMRDGVGELGLRVRTGLHCGEVETRGEQVTGLAVHAAARVMGHAGPDQVVISGDVAEALDGAVPLRDVGIRELRGVPGEWQLYEVGA